MEDDKLTKTPGKMPGKTKAVGLRVSSACNQGGRKYMEDVINIVFDRREDSDYSCLAVFDGHGGRQAAVFARNYLWENIKMQRGFFSGDPPKVMAAIRKGFHVTQAAMEEVRSHWPLTATGYPSTAGTTVALVVINKNNMYVAHVGDSRIVAGVKNKYGRVEPKTLTIDHKPSNRREIERIEKIGGQVLYKNGVPRVVWTRAKHSHRGPIRRSTNVDHIPFLAVARSLGDLWSYQFEHEDYLVSPDPDITHHIIDPDYHKFLVIGSDGLWNMMSVYDAVRQTDHYARQKKDGQRQKYITSAQELVHTAIDKWNARSLRADNTTAITVYFDHPNTLDDPNDQIDLESIRTWTIRGLPLYPDGCAPLWEPPPGGKWYPPGQRYPNRNFNPYKRENCSHWHKYRNNLEYQENHKSCKNCVEDFNTEQAKDYAHQERTVFMESPKEPWLAAWERKKAEQKSKKRKAGDEDEVENPSKRHKVQDFSPVIDAPLNKEIMVRTVKGMIKVKVYGFGRQAPVDYPKEEKKVEETKEEEVKEEAVVVIEEAEIEVETERDDDENKKEEEKDIKIQEEKDQAPRRKSTERTRDGKPVWEELSQEQTGKLLKEEEAEMALMRKEEAEVARKAQEGRTEETKQPQDPKKSKDSTSDNKDTTSNGTGRVVKPVTSPPSAPVVAKTAITAVSTTPPVLRKSPRNSSYKLASCLKDSNSVISPLAKSKGFKMRPAYNTRNSLSPKGTVKRLLRTLSTKGPVAAAAKRRASLPAKLVRGSSRAVTRSAVTRSAVKIR